MVKSTEKSQIIFKLADGLGIKKTLQTKKCNRINIRHRKFLN